MNCFQKFWVCATFRFSVLLKFWHSSFLWFSKSALASSNAILLTVYSISFFIRLESYWNLFVWNTWITACIWIIFSNWVNVYYLNCKFLNENNLQYVFNLIYSIYQLVLHQSGFHVHVNLNYWLWLVDPVKHVICI